MGMLLAAAVPALPSIAKAQDPAQRPGSDISLDDLKTVEKMVGIVFTDEERDEIIGRVRGFRAGYRSLRELPIDNAVAPPTPFVPQGKQPTTSRAMSCQHRDMPGIERPGTDEDMAFMTVAELSQLIKQKKISPVELTRMYIGRLEAYGEKLLNVITPTTYLALSQATKAEDEIMAGNYRGPLHGIPYGIKDLFSVKGQPTTWGSEPHVRQVFDYDAAVVEMLTEAGAVCCAKLSMGALAMNDHWHKGRTRNPWNPEQGSSGSSAGPGSAMAAGLVAFAIGTETQGSIISPSHRCRVTGLRPTFGRVSRHGAMTLSWSMDKAGPMCRT
ncbi:MAG: amidase, partial [Armatimonadetes bacterium]|nr:amidase [Armatimonadota bacterium]